MSCPECQVTLHSITLHFITLLFHAIIWDQRSKIWTTDQKSPKLLSEPVGDLIRCPITYFHILARTDGGWPSLEWLLTILGWWVIVLMMVYDHYGSGIGSSLAWWVTILRMMCDRLGDGGWGLNFVSWVYVPNFKSVVYFLVVDFGGGCHSRSSSCERGKTKSTPGPTWTGLLS